MQDRLAQLQLREELAIVTLERQGESVDRRGDADPAAVFSAEALREEPAS